MFIMDTHNATPIIVANSVSHAPVIMRLVDGTLFTMCVVGIWETWK